MIEDKNNLEQWYDREDPWDYENNPDDQKRKGLLLSEIPPRQYKNVLDIGCGNGFITKELKGDKVTGIDISENAITHARKNQTNELGFYAVDIFKAAEFFKAHDRFDLVIITGVLYPQYIGNAKSLIYSVIDQLLCDDGILISVHIDEWYKMRFPYLLSNELLYGYKDFNHRLEVYIK